MYAIIETGGKQYKVEQGDVVFVEKLGVEEGETVTFDKVLVVGGDDVKVGTPYVDGASVEASVVKNGKDKKIIVISINPKRVITKNRVTDSLTQKLKSRLSMRKHCFAESFN